MKNLWLIVCAGVVFALDALTKWMVVAYLPLHESVSLTPFFSLTHVRNTGAAFGFWQGGNVFFIVLTIAILILSFVFRRTLMGESRVAEVGLGLFWGGALGNLVDRVTRGNVVDFLDVFVRGFHWPAFNVADSAICVGAFLMAAAGSFTHRPAS